MAANRTAIYNALFARLQAKLSALATVSRVLVPESQLAQIEQPAVFLLMAGEETVQGGESRALPAMVALHVELWLYVRNDNPTDVPNATLATLLTEIETALERDPVNDAVADPASIFYNDPDTEFGTTLGGLCVYCRVQGMTRVAEGETGHGSIAQVPVRILTTA